MNRLALGLFAFAVSTFAFGCSSSTNSGGNLVGGANDSGTSSSSAGSGGDPDGSTNNGGSSNSSNPDGGINPGGEPDPALLAGCETLCNTLTEANCSSGQSTDTCLVGCQLAITLPACSSVYESLFQCAENTGAVCAADGGGSAELVGCEAEQQATLSCLVESAQNPALSESCNAYCEGAVDAACSGSPATTQECGVTCALAGTVLPNCAALWETFLSCADGAAFTCNDQGDPVPQGCELSWLLFGVCASSSLPGAGL